MSCQGLVGCSALLIGTGTWNSPTIWHPWQHLQTCSASESMLGHRTFVLRRAFILAIPWCPSWERRRTSYSGMTTLESHKTSLPKTKSSSLTHKYVDILHQDQSPIRMCCLSLVISGSLSEASSICLSVKATGMLSRGVIDKLNYPPLLSLGLISLSLDSASALFVFPGR